MKPEFKLSNRREFVGFVTKSAALLGLAAGVSKAAEKATESNPFSYDLSRFGKTDPKLIAYEEVARWRSPHKEVKRFTIGPDDSLLVCAGNRILSFDLKGKPGPEIELTEAACCVANGKNGTIYAGLRRSVEVYDTTGKHLDSWISPDKKSWFTGIALGGKDVFVADAGKRIVLRYDKSGKLIGRIGEKSDALKVPGFVVPSPYLNVVIQEEGLLRVNNPGRHQVELYTFDGVFKGLWGKPTTAIDGFCGCCNPIAIAQLPDGRVVTGEKGLPRVKIYSSTGEFEAVVAGVESFPENAGACSGLNDCAHGGLDVAVDSHGRIHILDLVTSEVRAMQRKT